MADMPWVQDVFREAAASSEISRTSRESVHLRHAERRRETILIYKLSIDCILQFIIKDLVLTTEISKPTISLTKRQLPIMTEVQEEVRQEEFDAVHAYFIGPKGSNLPDFRANINTILDELLAARQSYYPQDQVSSIPLPSHFQT